MTTSGQKVIGAIPLGDRAQIRVAITEFRGRERLDIRTYWQDDKGEWLPTKKGVSLDTELFDDLKALIEKAGQELGV